MSRKKILVVTPRLPFPIIGGDRLRIYNICKQLARYNDVSLVSLCSLSEMSTSIPDDGVFDSVDRIYHSKWKSILRTAVAFFSNVPLQVAYYQSNSLERFIGCYSSKYDVVLAHLVRTNQYLSISKSKSNILELTDAISLNYSRMTSDIAVKGLKYFAFTLERVRLLDYELAAIKSADVSVLISDVDRAYLKSHDEDIGRVIVSGNGIDLDNYQYAFSSTSKTLVFIGSMDFLPNLDGALWFAKYVMPELVKESDFRFKVIGRISPRNAKRFEKFSYVDVVGEVESVSEAAKGSLAGICSVRIGAGVQNKVLEYMGMSLPAIVSVVGSEGIGVEHGRHCLVADTVADYVSSVLKLHGDGTFAKNISASGRGFVREHFSWESQLQPYIELVESLPENEV